MPLTVERRRSSTCRRAACLFLSAALAVAVATPNHLSAQTARWRLDVSGSRIQYDTLEALNAPSVATSVEWAGSALLARVGGSLTGFQDQGQTLQGRAEIAGWFSPAGRASPLRLELGGGMGGSTHSSGFDAFVTQAAARLHAQRGAGGGWIGVGAARSKNSFDIEAVASTAPEAGAWVQFGPTRLVARFLDTRIEGERFPEITASAVYSRGVLDLTAFLGRRESPFDGVDAEEWAGGSATLWVQPHVGLVVSGGRYAPDLLQGLPGGDFYSVGIRIAPRRRRPLAPSAPLPLMFTREEARAGELGFEVSGARTVEVAGDFNAWQPTPLRRARDGRWLLPDDLEPGVYRFNLRIDGTRWIVPAEVPSVEDGFGGSVGILVISEDGSGGV